MDRDDRLADIGSTQRLVASPPSSEILSCRHEQSGGESQLSYRSENAKEMGMLTLLKYSTHDCSICQRMATFDTRVAAELGLAFMDVDMKNPLIYGRYRKVLLHHYPLKQNLGLPTYLLVDNPDGDFSIHGEIAGGLSEHRFQARLQELLRESTSD